MFRTTACVIGAVLASGIFITAQTPEPARRVAQEASADQDFASKAAIAGMAEVELGKIAMQRGSHAGVKSFGQQMVADHSKAGEELRSIAKSKGMMLPTSLDPMHQATRDRLAKLSGAEFDRAYMDAMVMGHQTVAAEMMAEANGGRDPELKAFAAKTLPTVQSHLKMAQNIQKEVAGAK